MRTGFQADLAEVSALLVDLAEEIRSAMWRATTALIGADAGMAEGVIIGDAAVNQLARDVEDKVFGLLARQAPVAGDLRLVVTALHIAADFERMGDLAKHVA
jgi:phosphate transport system protein